MQVKLLRVLQEREVRRVGENKGRPVNVRVLAATNRDLIEEIRAARFRQDLYYRLRVVEIRVPPLRERRDDILPLARTFLAATSERIGRKGLSFSPAAAHQLLRFDWPGNVRELENAVERAVVLATHDRIDVEDLPDEVRAIAATETGSPCSLAEVERKHIQAVLAASDGNRAKAAATLGIGVATLYRKLKVRTDTRTGWRLALAAVRLDPRSALWSSDAVSDRIRVAVTVNGTAHTAEVEPRLLLTDFLRQDLRLTGTHVGCEHGICGACTVLVERRPGARLPDVRRADRRRRGDDGGGSGTLGRRRAPPAPGGVPRGPRAAMRLLHARHLDEHGGVPARPSRAHRARHPRRPRRAPVPLHGLRQHRQGRRPRP